MKFSQALWGIRRWKGLQRKSVLFESKGYFPGRSQALQCHITVVRDHPAGPGTDGGLGSDFGRKQNPELDLICSPALMKHFYRKRREM